MIDFNKMIDNFLFREQRKKTIGRYYPSEIGTCMRKIWFSYKYPIEQDPAKTKVFKMGDILHDFVSEVFESNRNSDVILLNREFPFRLQEKDFLVSGRIDNLILIKDANQKVLVEVKSTKNLDFINEPQDYHEMQLQMYMHAFSIENGIVLYVEKNTLNTKVFPVEYNPEKAREILERFKKLHYHLTSDTLPRPEAKDNQNISWICRFCEYQKRCDELTVSE